MDDTRKIRRKGFLKGMLAGLAASWAFFGVSHLAARAAPSDRAVSDVSADSSNVIRPDRRSVSRKSNFSG